MISFREVAIGSFLGQHLSSPKWSLVKATFSFYNDKELKEMVKYKKEPRSRHKWEERQLFLLF